MDQFKFSLGPFELFSAIISGIPLLLAIFLGFQGNLSIEANPMAAITDISFTSFAIGATLCYLTGVVMSGFSFKYFKWLSSLFKKSYSITETKLLEQLHEVNVDDTQYIEPSKNFTVRLAYLVKKHLGNTSAKRACTRLLPYLRKHAPHLAAHADQFMAQKIMLRNLSLGFLILGIVLLVKTLVFDRSLVALYFVSLLSLTIAWLTYARALTFRGWWAREILIGFYHQALGEEG